MSRLWRPPVSSLFNSQATSCKQHSFVWPSERLVHSFVDERSISRDYFDVFMRDAVCGSLHKSCALDRQQKYKLLIAPHGRKVKADWPKRDMGYIDVIYLLYRKQTTPARHIGKFYEPSRSAQTTLMFDLLMFKSDETSVCMLCIDCLKIQFSFVVN